VVAALLPVETTLTNFERSTFNADPRRFHYEECSFQPHRFEMLGFGPSAISFGADAGFREGLKVLNPQNAEAYNLGVDSGRPVWDRWFAYHWRDLQILYLTRRLAALEIDRREYQELFVTDPWEDFAPEFRAIYDEGLLEVTPCTIRPTVRGMFYADSIASIWAWRRSRALDEESVSRVTGPHLGADRLNSNGRGHM
jgi:coproporphyrinogen III oxidase-like Fe-S oxidoreductase